MFLWLVRLLLTTVIVAAVVHDTSIVDRRAFLLTRPLTPGQTLLAKFITLGAAFVAIPAAIHFARFAHRGMPLGLVALDTIDALLGWRLVSLLMLLLVATLTSSLFTYLVTLAGGAVVLTIGIVLQVALFGPTMPPDWQAAAPEPVSLDTFEVTRTWLTTLATCGIPLVLLARRRRDHAIAALGVLLVLAIIPWWPPLPRLLAPPVFTPPAWASDGRTPTSFSIPSTRLLARRGSGRAAASRSRGRPPRVRAPCTPRSSCLMSHAGGWPRSQSCERASPTGTVAWSRVAASPPADCRVSREHLPTRRSMDGVTCWGITSPTPELRSSSGDCAPIASCSRNSTTRRPSRN